MSGVRCFSAASAFAKSRMSIPISATFEERVDLHRDRIG